MTFPYNCVYYHHIESNLILNICFTYIIIIELIFTVKYKLNKLNLTICEYNNQIYCEDIDLSSRFSKDGFVSFDE